jgi:hypothetical protein
MAAEISWSLKDASIVPKRNGEAATIVLKRIYENPRLSE